MQRRQLDRNAGIGSDAARNGGGRDGRDRVGIGFCVARCVIGGHRGFAEHVVGIGEALRLFRAGALDRGGDVFAQDELAAHLAHGLAHGGADDRLAQAADHAAQGTGDTGVAVFEDLACQQEPPGRGVDQR